MFRDRTNQPIPVEITTYRSEVVRSGQPPPRVALRHSIEDDLARRDITINAIAVNLVTGELVDPFHGQADLRWGLRAVGDPDERFREDPLRAAAGRAVRVRNWGSRSRRKRRRPWRARRGNLSGISVERVYAELTRLL